VAEILWGIFVELASGEAKCKSTNQQLNMRKFLMPTAVAEPPNTKTRTTRRVIHMVSGQWEWERGLEMVL